MKKWKRILAGMLAASMMTTMMTVPAFAEEENSSDIITVGTGVYGNEVTAYYANGNPVTVEEVGGTTYVHLDTDLSNEDSSWVEIKIQGTDKYTAVVAGSVNDTVDSAKITMKSGNVTFLIASSTGSTSNPNYYIGSSEIIMEGGTVNTIYGNRAHVNGGAYTMCEDRMVVTCKITITGDSVVKGYVYGCFGYTGIGEETITVSGNAKIKASLLAGATNGYLGKATVVVDGEGVEIGEIAGCQRTLVEDLTLRLMKGKVNNAISVGSIYNAGENYENYWKSEKSYGNVHYGVVKNTDLYIGKDFAYRGVYGGIQFIPEEVKQFYSKFHGTSDNINTIIESYGLSETGEMNTTATIHVEAAPDPTATGRYLYLGVYRGDYEGKVPNLLTDTVEGVTVEAAPSTLKVTPETLSLREGEQKNVQAEVSLMASAAANTPDIEWKSSDDSVASVTPSEDRMTATITGNDIGAAVITASYTVGDVTKSDTVSVSVGGEFGISVNPSKVKIGDTITFTPSVTASDSDAVYEWSISEDVVAEAETTSARVLKAKAVGAGTAAASLTYTDKSGTESQGNVAFTVEAPQVALTVPASVELGQKFKAVSTVSNITGSMEELGITNTYYTDNWNVAMTDVDGEFVVVDISPDEPVIIGTGVKYPSTQADALIEVEKQVAVTVPAVETAEITLDAGDTSGKKVTLPTIVKTIAAYGDVSVEVREGDAITVEYDAATNRMVVCATADAVSEKAWIDVILPESGTVLASYPVTVGARSIELDQENVTLYLNDTITLTAITEPAGQNVIWKSSNTSVAEVESGVIRANGVGRATITATLPDGQTVACTVRVKRPSVELNQYAMALVVGASGKLEVVSAPEGKAITWVSLSPEIAVVDENGVVTAVAGGTACIQAKINGVVAASCDVTVSVEAGSINGIAGSIDVESLGEGAIVVPSADSVKLPEGTEMDAEEIAAIAEIAVNQALEELAFNDKVTEKPAEGLVNAVEIEEELAGKQNANVYVAAVLKNLEMETSVSGEGADVEVQFIPKKLVYDAKAYMSVYNEDGSVVVENKVIDNSKLNGRTNITFRLPIPSSVAKKYAKVVHTSAGYATQTFYLPIKEAGTANAYIDVTVKHFSDFTVTFENSIPSSSSGSGSSGSGSGSGSSGYTYHSKTIRDVTTNMSGEWVQNTIGWWFRYSDGTWPAAKWVELDWNGVRSWYYFNADGYMATGWKLDADHYYYLHPYADGTQGYMYTGWHEIGGKWYYFSNVSGGPLGSMAANTTTPDGYQVGADGAWIQ